MIQKSKEKLQSVGALDPKIKAELLDDIRDVASFSIDEETWQAVLQLFRLKWEEEQELHPEVKKRVLLFMQYFFDQWVTNVDVNRWYQGCNPCHVITNCSLEAVNNVLKQEYTKRQKVSLPVVFGELGAYLVENSRVSKKLVEDQPTQQKLYEAAEPLWKTRSAAREEGFWPELLRKNTLRSDGVTR